MDIEQVVRDYLPGIVHMSLATVRDGKPWVCEVHFVYDDKLNLYFRSLQSRRHSQEIALNPQVAGNIVVQHSLGQPARAVYFEGQANMIENEAEVKQVFKYFHDRLQLKEEIIADALKPDGHKFYKISVETYYFFGTLGKDPAQKYELAWNKASA